jgi:glycosyltransferase involved in cell wall biosynthesis
MRRVLHIIDSLEKSSAAYQLSVLAKGLVREGDEVQIAVLDDQRIPLPYRDGLGAGSLERTSPRTVTLGRRCAIDPLAFVRLWRLIHKFQPAIIHTWDLDSAMYGGAALKRGPRRLQGRTLPPSSKRPRLVIGHYRIERWKSVWQHQLAQRLAGPSSRLVTNSSAVRQWYAAQGWSAEDVIVVPSGAPAVCSSDVSREPLLAELKLPADARLIGVIDRLVSENRVKDLIWAADLLRVLHDNLRLLVIGDGPLRSQLEEYARLASDLDHIRFLGDRPGLCRILPHLDVLWNGGENVAQSATILQAMAAGVPVVASDTPTNRELVVDGETGYLIPLGTRSGRAARARNTDRIFTDSSLSGRLSSAARDRATQQFNAERMIERYREIYHDADVE